MLNDSLLENLYGKGIPFTDAEILLLLFKNNKKSVISYRLSEADESYWAMRMLNPRLTFADLSVFKNNQVHSFENQTKLSKCFKYQ